MARLNHVSAETINLEFRHLKAIFNRARFYRYIDENPFQGVKPIRVPENELPRFLELEEITKVRELFKIDLFQHLIEFYLLTGAPGLKNLSA